MYQLQPQQLATVMRCALALALQLFTLRHVKCLPIVRFFFVKAACCMPVDFSLRALYINLEQTIASSGNSFKKEEKKNNSNWQRARWHISM